MYVYVMIMSLQITIFDPEENLMYTQKESGKVQIDMESEEIGLDKVCNVLICGDNQSSRQSRGN